MSSTLKFDASSLCIREGYDINLLPCVHVVPSLFPYTTYDTDKRVSMSAEWRIIIGKSAYEISPCNKRNEGQVGEYTESFIFTGFHSTCLQIVKLLDLKTNQFEIY